MIAFSFTSVNLQVTRRKGRIGLTELAYDRERAVAYAHEWAYARNPRSYNFNRIGGDCTNFASQTLYAGCGRMNTTPVTGWYDFTLSDRSPSWTSVRFFAEFLLTNDGVGPYGVESGLDLAEPGDIVQLQTTGTTFHHTPVIVAVKGVPTLENILVAAHSEDCDMRPLSTYPIKKYRLIHILGCRGASGEAK